jgi:hypothetical protein
MFLQETTANTDGYMIAGFAISFMILLEEMDKPVAPVETSQPKPKKTAKSVTKRSGKK